MSSDARAMVTMPCPMLISTDFWAWASRQPDRAVMAPEMHRPTVVVKAGLMEEERTMSGLLPVARMARPSRVRRNTVRKPTTSATARNATSSSYRPARGVPASRALALEKMVSVLFIFNKEAPPMTAMFTEYRPVLTMMPASRLSTPIFVWSMEVTKPDTAPASMAAGMDSQGWPAMATAAPTAAPKVKQPSVDRSQTLSML